MKTEERSEKILLAVDRRENKTTGQLNRLRKEGDVPGIVYGAELKKNIPIRVKEKILSSFLGQFKGKMLIDLQIGSEKYPAIIKEIQRDVLTGKPLHIDFQVVSLKKKVEVSVPVELTGVPVGVSVGGGILEHITRQIRVRCLPTEIPERVAVDVSELNIGDSITVSQIKLAKGEILTDPRTIIANVIMPKEEVVAAPTPEAVAATPAEPEVIGKGKKEEAPEAAEGPVAQPGQPAGPGGEKEKGKK